mgnify:CR=1 FL=1
MVVRGGTAASSATGRVARLTVSGGQLMQLTGQGTRRTRRALAWLAAAALWGAPLGAQQPVEEGGAAAAAREAPSGEQRSCDRLARRRSSRRLPRFRPQAAALREVLLSRVRGNRAGQHDQRTVGRHRLAAPRRGLAFEPDGGYVVVVLSNLDPPAAGRIAAFILSSSERSAGEPSVFTKPTIPHIYPTPCTSSSRPARRG